MIFHTAADPIYYNRFYDNFQNSIKANYPNPKFSIRLIGKTDQTCNADLITTDSITFEEIKKRYRCDDRSAKGYYCISRWLSIPIKNEHVCVSDVDVIAVNKIDSEFIEDHLNRHKIINLTRIKNKGGKEGGMMIFFLHKDVCNEIKNYSLSVLEDDNLTWATDVKIRTFLYENYNVYNLLKMQEISKSKSAKIDNPWFVFSKVNKFENLIY